MGDRRRSELFARFIVAQFPKAKSVLAVADGKGELARKLANKRRSVRVVDPWPRFAGRHHKRIVYEDGLFTEDSRVLEDVLVGMHPDEATAEIILAAKRAGKPWAVVPCCLRGRHANRVKGYWAWLTLLASLDPPVRRAGLRMSGRNIVLYRRRR